MGVDAKWGRFPICPEMCPRLSSFVPICPRSGPQEGQKRTNGDKTGHFGTNWETPPFSIYPHLALLNTVLVYSFGLPVRCVIRGCQRSTFWVWRQPGGVGVFHAKGWWSKSSCPPSKVCLCWVSREEPTWDVPGILPGCPRPLGVLKKFVSKNVRAHFSFAIVVSAPFCSSKSEF